MLSIGDVLRSRYRVDSIIGTGGMSVVYLVYDIRLQTHWAMKETNILIEKGKEDIISQFEKEAKILANLSHPSLPRVIDYFCENGKHYLIEEYIEGVSSEEIINKEKISEARILRWAIQICELLHFLHSKGIIYRDLKPSNILIDEKDNVYLVDFGIARFFSGGKNKDTVIIGTPGFASPEHYGRGETDARSDIFSLGATLHYMLTGVDPALNPFHFEIPYVVNSDVSFQTSSIVMKCLEMDPNRRFQSALQVKEAIEKLALPNLRKKTQFLREKSFYEGRENYRRYSVESVERYRSGTDILGRTAQYLSYTSIFPAAIGISGVLAFGASFFGPVVGFVTGVVTFPILCMELWKRLEKAFKEQEATIEIRQDKIVYKTPKWQFSSPWEDVLEVKVIKNHGFSIRRIKEIRVITITGKFSFDASFKHYRKLLDTIIVKCHLCRVKNTRYYTLYKRI